MARKVAVKSGKGGGNPGILIAVIAIPAMFFFLPTVVMVFFALLPTFAAFLVERGPGRTAWLSVGGLNLAGACPFLLNLWFDGHTLDMVASQMGDMINLMIIYGAAAFGWLMHAALPPVVNVFLSLTVGRRVATLREQQKNMVAQWGPEIAGDEMEKADGGEREFEEMELR